MKYKQGEPTVRNRASIIKTDLLFQYYKQGQLNELLPFLVERDYDFSFGVEKGDSVELDVYWIQIENISWAHNAREIMEFVETLDYNMGQEDEK
jgi:hypothetical protein